MESFEYAIKKDVRNNAIVREVDEARQLEQWKWLGIGASLVLVLLFSVWQRSELRSRGYEIGEMQRQLTIEENEGRHLLLELEALRSPQRIETFATGTLHMVQPSLEETIVIERVQPADPPSHSVVAAR
jgi:cell division protein FtsL